MSTVLELTAVAKTFTMHLQGGIRLPVVTGVAFVVRAAIADAVIDVNRFTAAA